MAVIAKLCTAGRRCRSSAKEDMARNSRPVAPRRWICRVRDVSRSRVSRAEIIVNGMVRVSVAKTRNMRRSSSKVRCESGAFDAEAERPPKSVVMLPFM